MKVFSSAASRRKVVLSLLGAVVGFIGLYLAARQYAPFLFDATALRDWLSNFGIMAPVVFIVLQSAQVVAAPIPGQVAAVVAGYLFGVVWGTVYSLIGVMIGSAVAFTISKCFGRPAVERLVHEDFLFPASASATYAGGQFATGEFLQASLLLVVFVAISATAYYNRDRIQRAVRGM